MSERDRIEQALTFDTGCEPSAQEIIDALNRAGFQITPQAGEAVAWRYKDTHGHWRYVGNRPHQAAFLQLKPEPLYTAPPRPVCPHLRSSDEGTQWCDLAVAPVWQDIETAPKHYTPIILKQGSTVGEGCHATHIGWEFFNSRYVMRRDPTHWQPLPPDSPGHMEES